MFVAEEASRNSPTVCYCSCFPSVLPQYPLTHPFLCFVYCCCYLSNTPTSSFSLSASYPSYFKYILPSSSFFFSFTSFSSITCLLLLHFVQFRFVWTSFLVLSFSPTPILCCSPSLLFSISSRLTPFLDLRGPVPRQDQARCHHSHPSARTQVTPATLVWPLHYKTTVRSI